jgi:hypothetical protein
MLLGRNARTTESGLPAGKLALTIVVGLSENTFPPYYDVSFDFL